jgi:ketosteroid isomerase-like protein
MTVVEVVLERLQAAQNAHDLDALVDCFHPEYVSEQPRHPGRAFRGTDQIRRNWSELFETFPQLTVELLRQVHDQGRAGGVRGWTSIPMTLLRSHSHQSSRGTAPSVCPDEARCR